MSSVFFISISIWLINSTVATAITTTCGSTIYGEEDTTFPIPNGAPTRCNHSNAGHDFYVSFYHSETYERGNFWINQDSSRNDISVAMETRDGNIQRFLHAVSFYAVPFNQTTRHTFKNGMWVEPYFDAPNNSLRIERNVVKLFSFDNQFFSVYVAGDCHGHGDAEPFTRDIADGFMAIPADKLGKRYYATCNWYPFKKCDLSVAAIEPETNITLMLPNPAKRCSIRYKGHTYTNGESLNVVIGAQKNARIQADCDLGGTLIVADKKVAVWSGNGPTEEEASIIADRPSHRQYSYEQLLPVDSWGNDCVAFPTPSRDSNESAIDDWVITAAFNGTRLRVDSTTINNNKSTYYNMSSGGTLRLRGRHSNQEEWKYFKADKPIQVAKFSNSIIHTVHTEYTTTDVPPAPYYYATRRSSTGSIGPLSTTTKNAPIIIKERQLGSRVAVQPSMTLCISSNHFLTGGINAVTLTSTCLSCVNFLIVITFEGAQNGLRLDGQPLQVVWTKIPNSNLVGSYLQLDQAKDSFHLEQDRDGDGEATRVFQAYIYASGDEVSIGYPVGACF